MSSVEPVRDLAATPGVDAQGLPRFGARAALGLVALVAGRQDTSLRRSRCMGRSPALVIVYARTRWRWAALALPGILAPPIGVARVYVAAHHPTDVTAGLLLGAVWVLICTRLLLTERP